MGNQGPEIPSGINWGTPFQKGSVMPDETFSLMNTDGELLPLQYWPMAFWPDGSLKWAGFSTVTNAENGLSIQVGKEMSKKTDKSIQSLIIHEDQDQITINSGNTEWCMPRQGKKFISSIKINDKIISNGGYLVCTLQEGMGDEYGTQPERTKYISQVNRLTIEQKGPVRAVIKIEGDHISDQQKEIFPFTVRLYFYAGLQSIRMIHSFIYNADHNKDFVRGLGVIFDVPLAEELHNRHIRFSGEKGGIWDEPVKPLTGRFPLIQKGENIYQKQIKGETIENRSSFSEKQQFLIDNWASWNDFKLIQNNADGFIVQKRTNDKSAYINAGSGGRASGLVFVGEPTGGLTVCMKDFWQSYPSMMEVRNAKSNSAQLRAWLWSPEGQPMDMRHYDTLAWGHTLIASYEDVQPGFSTPLGIARTSEFMIYASADVPSIETLNALAHITNNSPLLSATPKHIHSTGVFGLWSLPDTGTPAKKWLEQRLADAFNFYKLEVEQRNWYGFWDYGDIMHSYDQTRHVWRYDIGGYAWDNTELMPNMWLWYAYLRSGKEDIFKMAEAMTKHTSEVDVYHEGRFKGLGSRHNVRHWGCGAKEVRISQAALNRFYYYLTTDERTGDLIKASTDASNKAIGKLDPLRLISEKGQYPTHARVGPDWFALAGNWMTEWERTGDTIYRDKILTGINSLSEMPYGLYSAKNAAFGYNPELYQLFQPDTGDIGYTHLSILMGGPEVIYELTEMLEYRKWDSLWLQFCRFYGASPSKINEEFGKKVELGDRAPWSARMPAYYAYKTNNTGYAEKAWEQFLHIRGRMPKETPFVKNLYDKHDSLEPIYEIPHISTNATAQWCLNAIELLEMIGDYIPEDHPVFKLNQKH